MRSVSRHDIDRLKIFAHAESEGTSPSTPGKTAFSVTSRSAEALLRDASMSTLAEIFAKPN